MVRPELALPGTELAMDILGERHPVTVIPESPYDPDNLRLRT
jgi:dimethylglycine dehydrogenase